MSEENLELGGQYEDEDLEQEINILQDMISTYLGRVEEINKQHQLGVEVENQTKIGDMISDGSRKEGEGRKKYKMRLKAEKLILKHYMKGVRGRA